MKRVLADSLDKILLSVVTIRLGLGHGTGFVISENGLIVTNAHVVGTAKKVTVILSNGVELAGEVLRVSNQRDVALVKVPIRVPSALPLRIEKPSPLEKVYVIGTPIKEGLRSTVTVGIVCAVRSDESTGLGFIQSDAAVSPGNSGGPLLDNGGNVIGITVLKVVGRASEGLNMFIPIKSALKALNIAIKSPGT